MNILKRLKAGIAAHQKGKLKIAETAYREVLAADPENPDALHFYGMLFYQNGDTERAVSLIRKSLAANPNNFSAQNNLGNILLTESKPVEAADAYGAAISIDPTQPEGYQNLGVLLRRIGKLDEAAEVLAQAAELNPKNPEAWHNLGICQMLRGKHEEAADAFESYVDAGISDRLNAVWHARILCAMGREQTALVHLERHLKRNPDDPIARHHVAAIRGEALERVPEDYVRQHFDAFASTFDETLRGLEYRAPQLVADALADWHSDRPAMPVALDLGCGTGLCGPLIAARCERLIGIDLSSRMLFEAARVGAYHELHEAELVEFLGGLPEQSIDCAVSADTLIYFGQLEPLMAQLAKTLRPGGALITTFEEHDSGDDVGYRLQNHGRYTHSLAYIATVAEAQGLKIIDERHAVLRREANEDVAGLVLTIERIVGT